MSCAGLISQGGNRHQPIFLPPGIQLHAKLADGKFKGDSHPSIFGDHLAACVVDAAMTGQKFEGGDDFKPVMNPNIVKDSVPQELTAERRKFLENIAWSTFNEDAKEMKTATK